MGIELTKHQQRIQKLWEISLVARKSHLSGRLAVFAPKFWARGGDLRRPFAIL